MTVYFFADKQPEASYKWSSSLLRMRALEGILQQKRRAEPECVLCPISSQEKLGRDWGKMKRSCGMGYGERKYKGPPLNAPFEGLLQTYTHQDTT